MLRRALSEHESQQAASNSTASSQDSFATALSSASAGTSAPSNPPFKAPTALKPSPSTALNARSRQVPLATNGSLKRTSSGLAKVFASGPSNGFSDYSSSASRSLNVPLSAMPSTQMHTRHETITIDEDDFDSDPELDVVNPAVKASSVAYPKLPSLAKTPSSQAPYPSLQRAQVHTAAEAFRDGGPPRSSAPLPWSSSPPEHKQAPSRTLDIQAFRHEETPHPPADITARSDNDRASSPVQRPTKRRHLPWAASQAQDLGALGMTSSTNPYRIDSTPASKSSGPAMPWNTSASAIKNNQKELRKMNRSKQVKDEASVSATVTGLRRSKGPQRVALSNEQQHVLDLVLNKNRSVFFTGSAGTGKSVLLREMIHVLRKKYSKEQDRVAVTASTGLAACNIGGVTLHSFAGIGLGKEEVPELVKKIKRNQKAKHRWMRTKVLVVDEVSMVDGELFDKLEAVARSIRNNGRPFGGIQIVITGDFFQLPPVPDGTKAARFCFDANTWDSAIDHTIGLHHVFRQKDPEFARMLNEMREGKLTKPSIDAFRALSRAPQYDDGLSTTELFPTRAEVDNANAQRMRNLHGGDMRFEARDGGAITDKAQRDRLLQNCMAPEVLVLKKGAQVMLIKNIDENLVNGSLGTVRGFMNEGMWDDYNIDPVDFEEIQNADIDNLNPDQLKKRRAMQLSANTSQLFPLVRFQQADGCTRDLLCNRESWKIELPNGEVQASRAQVPLILAWALSIHKAQGQTLERVKVDLGKVFERGQAYVALSRATTMNGLQVLRFDPAKVQAHEKVRSFYAGLSKVEAKGEEDSDA